MSRDTHEAESERPMLLKAKVAVVHGAGGAVGGAIASAFGRQSATVFASGRTLDRVEQVAHGIVAAGGRAEAARVDALDEQAVERYTAAVVEKEGGIDVCINAIGFPAVQGTPLTDLAHADFARGRERGRVPRVRPRRRDHRGGREPHRRDERRLVAAMGSSDHWRAAVAESSAYATPVRLP